MKTPKTDAGKISLPGVFAVVLNDKGVSFSENGLT
jgi:hypothetical protein